MGQTENVEKAPKTNWFKGIKAEFSKIIWPEQKSVVRQTIAVVAVSVVTAGLGNSARCEFPCWFKFLTEAK